MLHVDLVNNAVARRYHAHGLERALRPFHKAIALGVAFEFDFLIALHGVGPVVDINFHRVIDDDIHRHQRLDVAGRHTQAFRRCTHRRQIVQRAKADQVLQHDTHHDEGDFRSTRCIGLPRRQVTHVFFRDAFTVAVAYQGFQHHADGARQARNFSQTRGFERGERMVFAGFAGRRREIAQGFEGVLGHGRLRGLFKYNQLILFTFSPDQAPSPALGRERVGVRVGEAPSRYNHGGFPSP